MNPLAKLRANWKYIWIGVILAFIVGGGILGWWRSCQWSYHWGCEWVYQWQWAREERWETEPIDMIINKILPHGFMKRTAEYYITDLNEDGLREAIITATPLSTKNGWSKGYLVIITLLNDEGDYRKIADFYFDRVGSPPTISEKIDVNKDGWKEMWARWPLSSIDPLGSGTGHAVLTLNLTLHWPAQKINYLNVRNKEGKIAPAIFKTGFTTTEILGDISWQVRNIKTSDINKNGRMEIIEIIQQEKLDGKAEEESWEAIVYEWDGSIFSYNSELSSSGLGGGPGLEYGEEAD